MSGTLRFDGKGVARCLDHAAKCKKHRKACSARRAVSGLWFVHDQGVYLMSNGTPPDRVGLENGDPCFLVYAKGCDPKDEDWWERSCELVGGDDFVEHISVSTFPSAMVKALRAGTHNLQIKMTETELSMATVRRRKKG